MMTQRTANRYEHMHDAILIILPDEMEWKSDVTGKRTGGDAAPLHPLEFVMQK